VHASESTLLRARLTRRATPSVETRCVHYCDVVMIIVAAAAIVVVIILALAYVFYAISFVLTLYCYSVFAIGTIVTYGVLCIHVLSYVFIYYVFMLVPRTTFKVSRIHDIWFLRQ